MDYSTLLFVVIVRLLPISAYFAAAYLIHRLSSRLSKRFRPLGKLNQQKQPRRYERQRTIQALLSNAISVVAFVVALILSLGLFVQADTLLWVIGLFSAAFGLGARPFISDYLTGITFIFEDTFDVGDKIEIPLFPQRVEGVVEAVTLRITRIRGMDGELYTMPNGDIRLLRNFSRGEFSPTSLSIKVPAHSVRRTLERLESLGQEAVLLLPNLIEPWQVINKSGELGEEAELTILAKARFGKGAEIRTRLLALVQDELEKINIESQYIQPEEKKQLQIESELSE